MEVCGQTTHCFKGSASVEWEEPRSLELTTASHISDGACHLNGQFCYRGSCWLNAARKITPQFVHLQAIPQKNSTSQCNFKTQGKK